MHVEIVMMRTPDGHSRLEMRPLRYSINVTLDGCCDHRAIPTDEELHRYWAENLAQADVLLFGRLCYIRGPEGILIGLAQELGQRTSR